MHKAKRIFIVADISCNPVKMFVNAMRKLSKGFIRLGHDVEIFSYRKALFSLSPIKSKTFTERFFKSRVILRGQRSADDSSTEDSALRVPQSAIDNRGGEWFDPVG